MKKIVQVIGPTGVGKSGLSIYLAGKLDGEVISADSVQVYRGFDIGSSKVKDDESNGINHHMIDILSPNEHFSVTEFINLSVDKVDMIIKKKKLPIVCGGTALYLKAMISGIFAEKEERRISREKIIGIGEKKGYHYLWKRLARIDEKYALKIGKNDNRRIIRGLEIYYNNGVRPSDISTITTSPFNDYKFIRIGLYLPRRIMYERINERVDNMIMEGLVSEVKHLRDLNGESNKPMRSIGYKEICMYLKNEIGFEESVDLIKQHSRNFAKRQMTWFRSEKDINWFAPGQPGVIHDFLKKKLYDRN